MHKPSYTRQRQQYKASRPFKRECEKRGWVHLLRTRWSDDWRPCYRQAQRSASSVTKCVARPGVPTPPHASSLIRGTLRVLAMVTLDCSAVFPPEMFVDPLQILANTLQSSHSLPVESLTIQMLHALFNYWFVVSQQVEFVPSGGFSRLLHHDWSPNWPLLCTLFLVILTSGLRFCLGRGGRKVRTIRPTAPFLNDVRVERKMTRNESKKRNGERSSKPGVRFKGYTIGSVVRSEKTGETSVRFIRYLVAPAFIPEIHIFQLQNACAEVHTHRRIGGGNLELANLVWKLDSSWAVPEVGMLINNWWLDESVTAAYCPAGRCLVQILQKSIAIARYCDCGR